LRWDAAKPPAAVLPETLELVVLALPMIVSVDGGKMPRKIANSLRIRTCRKAGARGTTASHFRGR
jgi:hypothetical protein